MAMSNNTYGNRQQYIWQWATIHRTMGKHEAEKKKQNKKYVVQVIDSGLRFGRNFISELQIS